MSDKPKRSNRKDVLTDEQRNLYALMGPTDEPRERIGDLYALMNAIDHGDTVVDKSGVAWLVLLKDWITAELFLARDPQVWNKLPLAPDQQAWKKVEELRKVGE